MAATRRDQLDENRVLRGFDASPGRKDNFVKLQRMREHSGLPRERFDAAINRLRRRGELSLDSFEGLHGSLTKAEREGGIHEAGSRFIYASTREQGAKAARHRKRSR